ncbi:MAG: S1 RNA-binding domain-containing protein, partial [Thermoguttaceae bacterium]
ASRAELIGKLDVPALAAVLQVGELLLKDILAKLARPGRDPREDLPAPIFKHGIIKLEDLTPGMELTGTVLNVVDFGAFVDIGMHDSGLVHVSQLADKYVRDPHDVVAVGDVVKVWVVEVDKQRRRVSLTMILPGTQRTGGRREGKPQQQQARPQQTSGERPPRPPREQRKPVGAGGPPKTQRPPRTEYKPKRPPKPVKPLTDEMKTGKAPMRSFSDLIQFYEARQEPEPKPDDSKKQDPAE